MSKKLHITTKKHDHNWTIVKWKHCMVQTQIKLYWNKFHNHPTTVSLLLFFPFVSLIQKDNLLATHTHFHTYTHTHTHTLPWPKAHSVQLPTSPGSGGMTSPCLLWAVGPWEDRRGKRLRRGGMQSRIKPNGGRVRAIRGGKREI